MGIYREYLIIPNTFSEKVASVEEQPLKSTVQYALAKDLELNERDRTLTDVVNIYNTISNDLGRIYMSSLLKEYHAIQDATNGIMQRDTVDMNKLLEISGHDLVGIIEVPEMKIVDRNISLLDLQKEFTNNSEQVASINATVESRESGLNEILSEKTAISKNEDDSADKIKDAINKADVVLNPSKDDKDKKEDEEYNKQKDAIIGDEGIIAEHNKAVAAFNASVVSQYEKGNAVENEYRYFVTSLSSALGGVQTTLGSLQYNAEGGAIIADKMKFSVIKKTDVDNQIAAYENNIKSTYANVLETIFANAAILNIDPEDLLQGIGSGSSGDCQNYVAGLTSGGIVVPETAIEAIVPREVVKAPEVEIEENNHLTLPELDRDSLGAEVEKIVNTARTGRAATRQDIEDIKKNIEAIDVAYKTESTAQNNMNGKLDAFSNAASLSKMAIDGYNKVIQENNESILTKISKHGEEYEEYTTNVYETTNENVEALKKSIATGQEESTKKLEQGLESAKESREDSNTKNLEILQGFGSRLTYTRVGEQENKKVYDFIVDPLILENRSEPGIVATATAKETQSNATTATNRVADVITREIPSWVWIAVIGGLVAILSALGIGKLVMYKKRDEF